MTALALYRDDGPLARALPRPGRVPEVVLVAVAVVPLVVAIAVGGDEVSDAVAGAVIAWVVLWGAASRHARPSRLRWTQLAVLRAAEYGALLWLATLAGPSALPAVFALLAALAYRHYDLIYRMRLGGGAPPAWVNALALGWEGRLVGAYVLLLAGAVTAGFFVAAGVLAAVFVGESAVAAGRMRQPLDYEDEEDEEA